MNIKGLLALANFPFLFYAGSHSTLSPLFSLKGL
jgi:hypothetical protein